MWNINEQKLLKIKHEIEQQILIKEVLTPFFNEIINKNLTVKEGYIFIKNAIKKNELNLSYKIKFIYKCWDKFAPLIFFSVDVHTVYFHDEKNLGEVLKEKDINEFISTIKDLKDLTNVNWLIENYIEISKDCQRYYDLYKQKEKLLVKHNVIRFDSAHPHSYIFNHE